MKSTPTKVSTGKSKYWQSPAYKITLIYLIVAGAWILFSDAWAHRLTADVQKLEYLSIFKGWVFVAITGLMLFGLIQGWFSRIRKSEAELRLREEQLRLLGNHLPDSYVYQYVREGDGTVRFNYLSSGVLKLHGITAEAGQCDPSLIFDQIDPEQRPALAAAEAISLRDTSDFVTEVKIHPPSGQIRWVQLRSHPHRHTDGRTVIWDGVAIDITEKRLAAETLQASERSYREIFNATGEAIFLHDPATGKILDVNETTLRMYGYASKAELLQRGMQDLCPNEPTFSANDAGEHIRRAVAQGPQVFEWQARRQNGEVFWVEVSLHCSQIGGQGRVLALVRDISRHKLAETALRQSEESFRSMVESLPLAIYMSVGLEETCEYLNPTFIKWFGYTMEDVPTAEHWFQRAYPDATFREKAVPEWLARIERAIETKTSIEPMEAVVTCKDGSTKDILWGFVSLDKRNYAFGLDVTERNRALAAAAESGNFLDKIINSVADPMFVKDEEHRLKMVNDAYCSFSGRRREALLGKHDHELYAKAEADAFQARDRQVLSDGRENINEETQTVGAGQVRTILTKKTLYTDDQGHKFIVGIINDITERKQAEERLRRSEQRYRALVEQAAEAIFVSGPDRRYLEINTLACEMFGYTREEFLALSARDLVPPHELKQQDEVFRRIHAGERVQTERQFRRKDGSSFPGEVVGGKIEGELVLAIVRDITDRKHAEAALRESEYFFKESQRTARIGSYKCDFVSDNWESSEVLDEIFGLEPCPQKKIQVWTDLVHPADRPKMAQYLAKEVIAKGQRFDQEYRIVRPANGQTRWVHGLGELSFDPAGKAISMIGIIQDITDRKRHEKETERLSRLYAALSEINQCIVREKCRDELFARVCRGLVEQGRFKMAWIGIADYETQIVNIVAQHGDTTGYINNLRIRVDGQPEGRGPAGTCIREGRTYVCNDFATAPSTRPWQAAASRAGLVASISVPIRCGGNIFGALTAYTDEKGFFGEKEIGLMEEVAVDLSHAIEHLDQERRRRKAESALKESEEKFRLLVESSPDAIIVQTRGCFAYLNSAAVRLFGAKSATTLLGTAILERLDEQYHQTVQNDIRQINEFKKPLAHGERIFLRLDGSPVTCEISAAPIHYEGHDGALVFVHNLTERRQIENQLRLLSSAVQQTPVTVVITNAQGLIEYVNPQFSKVTGYAFEEAIGKNPRILKSEKMPPSVYQALWSTVTQGKEWQGTLCNRKKNGELFWEEVSIAPVLDNLGHITHYIALKQDISFRRQAEEQIRRQARLLDLARDAVIVCGADSRLSYWNKAFEQLTGWTTVNVVGRRLGELLKGDEFALAAAMHAVREHGEWTGELEGESQRGRKFTLLSRWTLVRERDDDFGKILSINTDITEKKQFESQFLRSQRLESIGSLASGIAHDLKNILSPILLCAPMLNDDITPAERQGMVNVVEQSARRAADIVRQLLGFSRGKEGQKVPLQIRHLVREMGKIVTETFPRSIRLEATYDDNLWAVLGNVTQLHQILLNLCVNARDAMPGGGQLMIAVNNVRLDESFVSMNTEASVGPFVRVCISDTGQGIPEAIRDKIFDPFFTTKPLGQGTGLGLATVQSLIKEHGGFITFRTQEGKGTTFEFYLPALPEDTLAENLGAAQEPVPRGQGELILLVDDESAINTASAQALCQHGYQVVQAANGIEAIKQFTASAGTVRLVVSDLFMPLMDGTMLCRALRSLSPTTPIIVSSGGLTGPAALENFRTLGELGISNILHKPHTAEALLKMIDKILHPRAGSPSGPGPKNG